MITTTELKGIAGDIAIDDLEKAGLPHPSIVRTVKFSNVQESIVIKKIGSLDAQTRKASLAFILSNLLTLEEHDINNNKN